MADEPLVVMTQKKLQALKAEASFASEGEGERKTLRKVSEQIRHTTHLQPWMFAYAEWLTLACAQPPTRSMRRSKARSLARMVMTERHIQILEAREDFKKYCDELAKGPLEQARAKFVRHFPEYVEAHAEALDSARRAGDYTAVARIAEPILDRVLPKKAEGVTAAQVTVILTPQQVAGVHAYAAPAMLVEEATPAPAITDGSISDDDDT